MYESLKNIDHSFDIAVGDVGCTIRKGDHWSTIPVGTDLLLMNCSVGHRGPCAADCINEGTGRILGHWKGEFGKLPPALLGIEHNVSARNFDVLREMMRVGYGDIADGDIITALVYVRNS